MNILIAGGTGFIGRHFIAAQEKFSHRITVLSRQKNIKHLPAGAQVMHWDRFKTLDKHALGQWDCVINLCGKSIASRRWSTKEKRQLFSSRMTPTQILTERFAQINHPVHLLHASGVGIYGPCHNASVNAHIWTEKDTIDSDKNYFLQTLAIAIEEQALKADAPHMSQSFCRLAPVLSFQGGILKKLLPSYRCHLGGKIGSGKQPFPWIHIDDAIAAMAWLITNKITGPVNLVAPEIISQYQFAKALADRLHKPCAFFLPEKLIEIAFGQMGKECLLSGQQVAPEVLLKQPFSFLYPSIESALNSPF